MEMKLPTLSVAESLALVDEIKATLPALADIGRLYLARRYPSINTTNFARIAQAGEVLGASGGFWCRLVGGFASQAVREIDHMNTLVSDDERENQARRYTLMVRILDNGVRCCRAFDVRGGDERDGT